MYRTKSNSRKRQHDSSAKPDPNRLKTRNATKPAKSSNDTPASERRGVLKFSKATALKSASSSAQSGSSDSKSHDDDSAFGSDSSSTSLIHLSEKDAGGLFAEQQSTSKQLEPSKMATAIRVMSTDRHDVLSIVKWADDVDRSSSKGEVRMPLVKEIVEGFKELRSHKRDDSLLNIQLCGQNFVIALIGPKGRKISFPDGSVEIDVPPGALSKKQIIYCFRRADIGYSTHDRKGKIFYSIPLRVKAEEEKFKKKVQLRFRHFAKFEKKSEMKQLVAFMQHTGDSEYKIDNNADLEIDEEHEEWVTLKVNDFCNRAVGAEERVNVPPPALKFLAASFLTYMEFSIRLAVNLTLLVGPDDPAHMKNILDWFRQERSSTLLGQVLTVKCSPTFESFSRRATSGLRIRCNDGHYIVQRLNKELTSAEVDGEFIYQNGLKRAHGEVGFQPETPFCSVKIIEKTNGEPGGNISKATFDITWQGHEDLVQTEENVMQAQGHAGLGRPPIQADDSVSDLADDFNLQVRISQPSEQD